MDEFLEITELFDDVVAEMSTDPGGLVPLRSEIVQRITDGDEDPRFATFVISSGWSKSKRYWPPELFGDVVSEINAAAEGEPIVGYMGHIKPENDPYEFPDIQLQWAGAKLLQSGEKAKLAVKAYVLPGTKGRDYLKRGLVKTVSWRGKVTQEMFQQGVKIKKFAVESIDLSRPRAAGMSARMVGALTSEMETEGGNSVKPEEIAALQENELRAHNPTLVQSIENSVRTPLETQVSEMTEAATAVQPTLNLIPDLRRLLGLDESSDDVSVVTAAIAELRKAGKTLRESLLDTVLGKKNLTADNPNTRLARQVIVGEMRDKEISITGKADEDEKTVTEMVNSVIDADESLKEIVSEISGTAPEVPNAPVPRGTSRDLKAGFKSSTIRVRAARR